MPKPSGRFKRGENLELKNKTDKEKSLISVPSYGHEYSDEFLPLLKKEKLTLLVKSSVICSSVNLFTPKEVSY